MTSAAGVEQDVMKTEFDQVVDVREDDDDDDDEYEDALADLGHLAVDDNEHEPECRNGGADSGLPHFSQPLDLDHSHPGVSQDRAGDYHSQTTDSQDRAGDCHSQTTDSQDRPDYRSQTTDSDECPVSTVDSSTGASHVSALNTSNRDLTLSDSNDLPVTDDHMCGSRDAPATSCSPELSCATNADHVASSSDTDDFTCDPPPMNDVTDEDILGAGRAEDDDSDDEQDTVRPPAFEVDEEEERVRELELEWSEEEKEEKKSEADSLKSRGNQAFKSGEFDVAEDYYTQALSICPTCFANERSIIYSNRSACKLKKGEEEASLVDCTRALKLNPDYIKCLLRRAELYERAEKLDEALTDYKHVYELDPSVQLAPPNILRLEHLIHERNEKMKEEMLGQLKNLGNMILKPFGLSTDNFQLQQDPNSGGYSINFQR